MPTLINNRQKLCWRDDFNTSVGLEVGQVIVPENGAILEVATKRFRLHDSPLCMENIICVNLNEII